MSHQTSGIYSEEEQLQVQKFLALEQNRVRIQYKDLQELEEYLKAHGFGDVIPDMPKILCEYRLFIGSELISPEKE
jgi:hypothetical protein